jgi:hypothetical protein
MRKRGRRQQQSWRQGVLRVRLHRENGSLLPLPLGRQMALLGLLFLFCASCFGLMAALF